MGLGNARGRLYTRHAGLLRYPADTSDKEWIAGHNLVNAVGGKTYIMVRNSSQTMYTISTRHIHENLSTTGDIHLHQPKEVHYLLDIVEQASF